MSGGWVKRGLDPDEMLGVFVIVFLAGCFVGCVFTFLLMGRG